jgi:16S rRNA (guanine(966)-N(2))-methyltransferase RsmD
VKEALFNILGPPGAEARALDLYAGSGALAFEALSRGCVEAVLVEQSSPALAALRDNARALGVEARVRVLPLDVRRAIARLGKAGERFDWIFLDPPYAAGEAERVLDALAPLAAPGAVVAYEHGARHPAPPAPAGLTLHDERRWGDTQIALYGPISAAGQAGGRAA